MRKAIVAAGGLFAVAFLAGLPAASAGSLMSGGPALAAPLTAQAQVEDVRWVRRCWQVRRWWNGRPHWVTRCRSVWVRPYY